MTKRKKNDFAPHIEGKAPRCEADGCQQEGAYKAPKSRRELQDYHYFCLDHVREHNQKWDFFAGMNPDEIEAFMQDAVTGHRPTWQRETMLKDPQAKLYAALDGFLHLSRRRTAPPPPQLGKKLRNALALFELEYPYTMPALRKRYKALVKEHHPDRNQGNALVEEKFKAITTAYTLLEEHLSDGNA